jgi:hypothetical protein
MAAKYQAKIVTPHGPRRCYEARIERKDRPALVAQFGGIPLTRQQRAATIDRRPVQEPYPRAPDTLSFGHSRATNMLTSAAESRSGPSPSGRSQPLKQRPRSRHTRIEHRVLRQLSLDQQITAVLGQQLRKQPLRERRCRYRHNPQLPQVLQRQRQALRQDPRHQTPRTP